MLRDAVVPVQRCRATRAQGPTRSDPGAVALAGADLGRHVVSSVDQRSAPTKVGVYHSRRPSPGGSIPGRCDAFRIGQAVATVQLGDLRHVVFGQADRGGFQVAGQVLALGR